MHGAPSVSYPVGRSRIPARLLVLLWMCGACCAAAACIALKKADWRTGLLLLAVVGAGVAAWRGSSHRGVPGVLKFDGSSWSIDAGAGLWAAQARVALDAQAWLLVRMAATGRPGHWIWLERRTMPERWQDLRRAIYSRPVPASKTSAGHGSAPAGAQDPLS